MTVKYKQLVRAKISHKKFRQMLSSFALDLTAAQIACLISLNRNSVLWWNRSSRLPEALSNYSFGRSICRLNESHQRDRRLPGIYQSSLNQVSRIVKNSFYFHLKECEFRFNYRQENLYSLLLNISKDNGLI